jgi:hypothetical protein
MQTRSQAKSVSSFSRMPSDPIPIANISEEIIVEESFPSEEPQEAKEEVDPAVEDKSSSIPLDDLVSALRSFGKSSKPETIGKLREPEPFTGKDPKKLKPFLFQCRLYFRGSSEFQDDTKRVTFALSYLRDVAQEWFEPGLSGLTDTYPPWLDSWDLFVDELQNNFGPFDESADVEHELTNLRMKDTQRISDYLVRFNSLAVRCPWGEPALRYRFYEGLPARRKDKICKGDGKPHTLAELRKKAQNIDARYWERAQERSREQTQRPSTQQKTPSSNTSSTTPQTTSKPAPSSSGSTSQASGSKPGKPKEAPKPQSTKPDLTGKLDSRGKLTQQERQRRIDNDLCMFCGKKGHKVQDCILRQNAAKARASSTTASTSTSTSTPAQGKDSASESKKQ